MDSPVDTLMDALRETGCVTVLKSNAAEGSIRLLCRVTNKKRWCSLLENVLRQKRGWEEHVCQQYFMKDNKLIYGWNFIINSEDIPKAVTSICRSLVTPIIESGDNGSIDSIPLVGAHRPANINFDVRAPGPSRGGPSHKGAFAIGK